MPGRFRWITGALLVTVVVVVAVGYGTTRSAKGADVRASRLTTAKRFVGGGIRMEVPPATAAPSITAAEALATYRRAGPVPGLEKQATDQPEATLVVFSNDQYGELDPNGGVKPYFQGVLAWVLTFPGVEVTSLGGPRVPDPSSRQATPRRCDFFEVVNATTGEYMLAFQTCEQPVLG